jgi:predicted NBD/HSP70 family sugar kinase
MRVADLVVRTGLTRPTVAQALSLLERHGWIRAEAEVAGQRIGRPAQLLHFRAGAGHVLGVDVGPHKVLATVADLAGNVVAEHRGDTRSAANGTEVMATMAATMHAALSVGRIDRASLLEVAVGTPGVVDSEQGTVLIAPSIPGWGNIPLRAELEKHFDCPVEIDNDVNLAVLAEQRYGLSEPVETLVFVQWGARLGAGIAINGKIHRGATKAAGEIGFMDLDETPNPRSDMGILERMVGSAAITELAARYLGPAPEVEAVFAAAAAGDRGALDVVDVIAARFARGIAPLLLILDPDLLVIGGGVSTGGGAALLDAVTGHLRARTLVPPRLALSELGDRAVAWGAVQSALDRVEERLFSSAAFVELAQDSR